jgi:VanZ family protein
VRTDPATWRALVRFAFVAALCFTTYFALKPPGDPGFVSDKILHFAAFAVLALLGSLAWPQRAISTTLAVTVFGGLIEIAQGTALIGRDMEFTDWITDVGGALFGLAVARTSRR